MRGQLAYELVFSLFAVGLITVGYVFLAQDGIPQASSLLGYTLGIVGFLLMLATETLYSLRKRLEGFHFGPMSLWLQMHIFTGIVGPYLVLLHSGWKFNGLLATVLTIVTGVIVFSGLVGRYIYTAVPRNLDGVALAVFDLEEQIASADQELQALGVEQLGTAVFAAATDLPQKGWLLVLARPVIGWLKKRQLRRAIEKLDAEGQARAAELEKLLHQRQRLQMELASLSVTRRLLALWYVFHIPLSAGLFTLAFIHIGAVLYYATFSR